ncbi:uncharacterized protein G2W53_008126 [Senna tora]|uniref:Uncharacterized protein n=1 Tax=Senna tora TaxID=362788 RepID=A0A834X8S5_9FABA|nr:uncharacterized protein G2W53_008126 [Senna tora]
MSDDATCSSCTSTSRSFLLHETSRFVFFGTGGNVYSPLTLASTFDSFCPDLDNPRLRLSESPPSLPPPS